MPYYFNAASHGLPVGNVYLSMAKYLQSEAEVGPDQALSDWAEALFLAKKSAASLISAPVGQIGISSTTTAAWHVLVSKLDMAGKRVLVTEHEWGDCYRALSARSDVEIQVLPPLDFNAPDVSSWAEYIDEDVAAIFVPMVTSLAGYRYPIEAIGALPRPAGTKLIIDAAQAIGQTEVDVTLLNCNALIATCRKWLRGPRQTALFWVDDSWQSAGVSVDAKVLAPADQNPALLIGLGAALDNYFQQPHQAWERQLILQGNIIRRWADENGVNVFGGSSTQSPIVSLEFDMDMLTKVQRSLNENGIIAKVVDTTKPEPLYANRSDAKNILRVSPHVYTTEADFQKLFSVIENVIRAC